MDELIKNEEQVYRMLTFAVANYCPKTVLELYEPHEIAEYYSKVDELYEELKKMYGEECPKK